MKINRLLYHFFSLSILVSCADKSIILQDKIELYEDVSSSLRTRRVPLYNTKYINQAKKNLIENKFIPSSEDLEYSDIKSLYKESYFQLINQDPQVSNVHYSVDLTYQNRLLRSEINKLEKELQDLRYAKKNKNSKKDIQKTSNIILKSKDVASTPKVNVQDKKHSRNTNAQQTNTKKNFKVQNMTADSSKISPSKSNQDSYNKKSSTQNNKKSIPKKELKNFSQEKTKNTNPNSKRQHAESSYSKRIKSLSQYKQQNSSKLKLKDANTSTK